MTDDTPERLTQMVHEAMTDALRDYDIADEVWRNDPEFGQAVRVTSDAIWEFATRQRDEAVGAAYEAAAEWLDPKNEPDDWTDYAEDCARHARNIRVLTPDDATTALAARDAETWNAAIEAAAKAIEEGMSLFDCEGGSVRGEVACDLRTLRKETPDAD